ncbi:MAG: lipoyl synthase [Elusimicrobia bacterium]|nr:lipoyl synthase [Elusimicrobiota bacterium]
MKYPSWIVEEVKKNKKDLRQNQAESVAADLNLKKLHTVCDEALCPNKGNCFKNGEATFLILGDICTRNCGFCSVKKGKAEPPDSSEPKRIADLAVKWRLKYVVFTSPTRDDLPDYGAAHYANVIKEIRKADKNILTEPLIPDFKGEIEHLEKVLEAGPSVLAHNIEMPERLYREYRKGSDYVRSLKILENSKKLFPFIPVKSSLILGLGEKESEIKKTVKDLFSHGCEILCIGQYLAPSEKHKKIEKFYSPMEFKEYEDYALTVGFKAVLSAPLVRSSYKAKELYLKFIGA